MALLVGWLLSACLANADSISNPGGQTVSTSNESLGDVPAADLNGWFFTLDPNQVDPSQPFTSPANIAIIDYWLSFVAELGDDPALLPQLYGMGMIDSTTMTAMEASMQSSNTSVAAVPEPVTGFLLGGGMLILGFFKARRTRLRKSATIVNACLAMKA